MRKLTLLRTAETERRKPEAKNADGTEPKDRTGKGKLEAARGKMEWAEELLDQERPLRLNQLQRIYSELLGVKEEAPEPFAGDAAYLWERLAFASTTTASSNRRNAACASRRNCSQTKAMPF